MMGFRGVVSVTAIAGALLVSGVPVKYAGAEEGASAADLLFDRPYLERVEPGSAIVYDYKLTSTDKERFGEDFTDTIRLRVDVSNKDVKKRTANLDLFSGARERHIGPMPQTSGNPAIMIVLEQDTFDLQRTLGGQPSYFRNKIRRALRDSAQVEKTTVKFGSGDVEARRITIEPFKGDANFSRVPEFADMVYEFVVADAVPGGVYSVSSYIPSPKDTTATLKKKVMEFSELKKM
jgi:DNA repair exonuclease SbcCD nuclease subunit